MYMRGFSRITHTLIYAVYRGQGKHRRRMETEAKAKAKAKAKVVASVWEAKFIQFLAALAVLPRSI